MLGIKIGKGGIVGSNAVVTKDIEPYFIVEGLQNLSKKEPRVETSVSGIPLTVHSIPRMT
jgi:acetyltransferase-like isoleucine patch superfamily enzyme